MTPAPESTAKWVEFGKGIVYGRITGSALRISRLFWVGTGLVLSQGRFGVRHTSNLPAAAGATLFMSRMYRRFRSFLEFWKD